MDALPDPAYWQKPADSLEEHEQEEVQELSEHDLDNGESNLEGALLEDEIGNEVSTSD